LPPGDPAVFGWFFECLQALSSVGDFVRARSLLDEAESAGSARDTLAQAWLQLARGGYWSEAASDDVQAWARAARESARAAYGAFEKLGERRGQFLASTELAHAAGQLCRFGEAAADMRDAARLARGLGDSASAYRCEVNALWSATAGPASPADVRFGLAALGPPPAGLSKLAQEGGGLLAELDSMDGRHDEASAGFAEADAIRVERGDTLGRGYLAVIAATAALRGGSPGEARTFLEPMDDVLARMGERGVRSSINALLARALAASDRPEDALRLADTSETLAESDLFTVIHAERARAAAYSALGQFEAAEAAARRALDSVSETDMVLDHAVVLLDYAGVLRRQGRHDEALTRVTEAEALARVKKSAALDAQVASARARQ
jgi:tetratricopeptide (TPR) repeat protein